MARIKRAVAAKKKRRTVMHRAKGYYGAASRTYISYSQFMHRLKVAGIELDRKVLAQMAYEDIESFNELATIAKKALEA